MDISKVRSCRIHPAIGIARVGGSVEGYFIGPEIPGEQRVPPDPKYGFKDKSGQLLRQVARFRVYGYDAAGNVVGELNAGNANVAWQVHVANHKAAWYQFDEAMDIPNFDGSGGTTPQKSARRNAGITGAERAKLVIDPGARTISGRNTKGRSTSSTAASSSAKRSPWAKRAPTKTAACSSSEAEGSPRRKTTLPQSLSPITTAGMTTSATDP